MNSDFVKNLERRLARESLKSVSPFFNMMHERVKMTSLFVMTSSPTRMGLNIILGFPSLEASFLRGVYRARTHVKDGAL